MVRALACVITFLKEELFILKCIYCDREFKKQNDLSNHITKTHIPKEKQLVKLNNVELNITNEDLIEYKNKITSCEICGRNVKDVIKYKGKFASNTLCIDHDHTNNKFRGLLCQYCNRQLGWYEKYSSQINNYLNK